MLVAAQASPDDGAARAARMVAHNRLGVNLQALGEHEAALMHHEAHLGAPREKVVRAARVHVRQRHAQDKREPLRRVGVLRRRHLHAHLPREGSCRDKGRQPHRLPAVLVGFLHP